MLLPFMLLPLPQESEGRIPKLSISHKHGPSPLFWLTPGPRTLESAVRISIRIRERLRAALVRLGVGPDHIMEVLNDEERKRERQTER